MHIECSTMEQRQSSCHVQYAVMAAVCRFMVLCLFILSCPVLSRHVRSLVQPGRVHTQTGVPVTDLLMSVMSCLSMVGCPLSRNVMRMDGKRFRVKGRQLLRQARHTRTRVLDCGKVKACTDGTLSKEDLLAFMHSFIHLSHN